MNIILENVLFMLLAGSFAIETHRARFGDAMDPLGESL